MPPTPVAHPLKATVVLHREESISNAATWNSISLHTQTCLKVMKTALVLGQEATRSKARVIERVSIMPGAHLCLEIAAQPPTESTWDVATETGTRATLKAIYYYIALAFSL